ncbi:hypothetical protein EJ06DRAFT_553829 [Trichodelitschia bisporula]|uniref:Uncharacterized protein n=1 Tax=Trichodelitschia bisporula TaxID=703511 RepID=A0A6G1I656_9PEZI|nr:hypothetical protein EJ06DRAFT_553829 [Trichodelitschia bisporula]
MASSLRFFITLLLLLITSQVVIPHALAAEPLNFNDQTPDEHRGRHNAFNRSLRARQNFDFNAVIARGCLYNRMMLSHTFDEAYYYSGNTYRPNQPPNTRITAQDMEAFGWEIAMPGPNQYNFEDPEYDGLRRDLSMSKEYPPNVGAIAAHAHDWVNASDGANVPHTGAYYGVILNWESGLIFAGASMSPIGRAVTDPAAAVPLWQWPPIAHWSDVVWYMWDEMGQAFGGGNINRLQWIIRDGIADDDTRRVIREIEAAHGRVGTWENGKQTYMPGSSEGMALLGTPQGRGVALLLIDHKHLMGPKYVSSITIFSTDPQYNENSLLFGIADLLPQYSNQVLPSGFNPSEQ